VSTAAGKRTPPAPPASTLAAYALTKRFGDRAALNRVSFELRSGELVGIVGPNGAGKTTLLSILAGVLDADEGELSRPGAEAGWVPQQPALYSKLSVAENLRLFARLEKRPDVPAAVERMLDQTGLRDRAGDEVSTLSGGNRQRVNIAIGLLAEPSVLLLDEPSASLDPRQRGRVWEFVLDLAGAGTAVVYSTHNIQEAERYAHRVLVLADGEILFGGSPHELKAVVRAEGGGDDDDLEEAFVAFLQARGH
jgi:ABC-2 type transport system ATP-binding protein